MLNNEEWKTIEEFPKYEVSNNGKVRNKTTLKVLSSFIQNSGYDVISFSKGRTSIKRTIHRLVAIAFLPNINNLKYVNHIDGNKHNNTVSNLEWCTNSENILHARRTGLNPYNKPTKGLKLKPRGTSSISSKYFGVCWDKARNKWKACVVYNNVKYCQKRFNSEVDAAIYRDMIVKTNNLDLPLNFI